MGSITLAKKALPQNCTCFDLNLYLRIAEELQRLDLNKTPKEERLAFFINLYNLMAIHAILVWGHPEGALERRKLLNDFKYVIGGSAYSLSDIQNGILRANQRPPYTFTKPFAIADKRFKVSLPYSEPLIHFALVSGNRSDPALRCYSPKNIDMELMEAARNFVQSGALALDLDTMAVSVTKILQWYSVDFGRNEAEESPLVIIIWAHSLKFAAEVANDPHVFFIRRSSHFNSNGSAYPGYRTTALI
ncbi:DEP domain-containing protein [Tanacetum coccineum]